MKRGGQGTNWTARSCGTHWHGAQQDTMAVEGLSMGACWSLSNCSSTLPLRAHPPTHQAVVNHTVFILHCLNLAVIVERLSKGKTEDKE